MFILFDLNSFLSIVNSLLLPKMQNKIVSYYFNSKVITFIVNFNS